jgi:hypothetical protein
MLRLLIAIGLSAIGWRSPIKSAIGWRSPIKAHQPNLRYLRLLLLLLAPAASNLRYLRLLLLLQSAAAAAAALAATLADAATAAWPPQGHQLFPGPGVSGTKLAGKKIGATANADGRHPGISRTKPGGDTMPKGSGAKPPRLCTKPVAAIGRSGKAVVIGLARRQRLPRLVGHDGVTEDDVEPRITSGR